MIFKTLLCTLAVLASSVSSLTIPTLDDAAHALEKRASALPVTGVPGRTHPRLEIRQMQSQQPDQYTLYILAMRQFQNQPQRNMGSYYQVAGIHGVPRTNWDGVGQCSACAGADGYCPHGSILFLGWHRAYLALFEQQVVSVAKQIANKYPAAQRQKMRAAANKLRLPYWDWAARPASGDTLPAAITDPSVTVNTPNGNRRLANPLHHHRYRNPQQMRYNPFTKWQVRTCEVVDCIEPR